MEYEVLYINDNGSAKVRMTIDGRVLEQDFNVANLDDNVKQGMAVFKSELDRNQVAIPVDQSIVGQVTSVDVLPEIPAADLEPEQPSEA